MQAQLTVVEKGEKGMLNQKKAVTWSLISQRSTRSNSLNCVHVMSVLFHSDSIRSYPGSTLSLSFPLPLLVHFFRLMMMGTSTSVLGCATVRAPDLSRTRSGRMSDVYALVNFPLACATSKPLNHLAAAIWNSSQVRKCASAHYYH